jgi:hypothetical protein
MRGGTTSPLSCSSGKRLLNLILKSTVIGSEIMCVLHDCGSASMGMGDPGVGEGQSEGVDGAQS